MFLGKSDGTFLGVAPGVGLTTKKGRIIMPLYVDRKETVAVYSDDNGETCGFFLLSNTFPSS